MKTKPLSMINRLRLRFIAISTLSSLLVISALLLSVNIINKLQIEKRNTELVNLLLESNGDPRRVNELMHQSNVSVDMGPGSKEDTKADLAAFSLLELFPKDFTREAPFESRFFTVTLSSEGEVSQINTGQVSAISSDNAAQMAYDLFSSGQVSGNEDNYRYAARSSDEGSLYVFLDVSRDVQQMRNLAFTSLFIGLLTVLAIFAISCVASNFVVRPFAEAYRKQKRFITDASHEIKTPLASIRSNVDVLELESGESSWIEAIRKATSRLDDLVQKLILLSRMEEREEPVQAEEIDVVDLLRLELAERSALIEQRKLKVHEDVPEELLYEINPSDLRSLLSLALDNACRYAADEGEISLKLEMVKKHGLKAQQKALHIEISNSLAVNSSLEPKEHSELFERFYRPDESRAQKSGGNGIGMSVIQAICESYGGSAKAFVQLDEVGQKMFCLDLTL